MVNRMERSGAVFLTAISVIRPVPVFGHTSRDRSVRASATAGAVEWQPFKHDIYFAEKEIPGRSRPAAAAAGMGGEKIWTTGRRILVVEDDPALQKVVGDMLTALGCRVDCVEDGLTGVSRLSTHRYELALLDLELQALDAHRLSIWLKSETPHTKCVVMTGCCQAEVAGFMLSGVVDAWLFKPFGLSDLRRTLETL